MSSPVSAPAGIPSDEEADLLGLLRDMLRIRRFEERCVELYSA